MLANIIAALDKSVYEPIVVCPEGDGNEQLIAAGAEVRISQRPLYQFLHYTGYSPSALNPYFLRHAFMMWRDRSFWEDYVRESGADIVCLNAMTLAPMAFSLRRAGVGVLCLVQETAVRGLLGIRTAWLNRILSQRMDAAVFISRYDRDKAACRAPLVRVIPNWIDLALFNRSTPTEKARAGFGIAPDVTVVLLMGGISKLKGTLTLVQAAALLCGSANFMVLIAGYSGPVALKAMDPLQRLRWGVRKLFRLEYRDRVMRTLAKHGLQQRVRFVGMQEDVASLYAAADILVFPASKPHQSRPVLEAGAMAKPVIVPDFPQTREFIREGFNGLTYNPGDATSLAAALKTLIEDQGLARQLGENNYRTTCDLHDGSKNAKEFQQLFDDLREMRADGR